MGIRKTVTSTEDFIAVDVTELVTENITSEEMSVNEKRIGHRKMWSCVLPVFGKCKM